MNKANDLLKKEIYNPYRINWLMYSIIGTASTILMVVAVIWNYYTNNIISEILKNLGFGCVASTIVALFIEIGNVKDKNENANKVYDAVYVDLKYQIMRYIEIWSELCCAAFHHIDYEEKKYKWTEWYEITKSNFFESDPKRQKELMDFFKNQLIDVFESAEKAINSINSQRYILNVYYLYDENIKNIIEDFRFVFYAAKIDVKTFREVEDFWNSLDSINRELETYINNWCDINYYNYCKHKPYKFLDDMQEIIHAQLEQKKSQEGSNK